MRFFPIEKKQNLLLPTQFARCLRPFDLQREDSSLPAKRKSPPNRLVVRALPESSSLVRPKLSLSCRLTRSLDDDHLGNIELAVSAARERSVRSASD